MEIPLLVSVRSGARQSMPGMMDTILNLGLTAAAVSMTAEAAVAKALGQQEEPEKTPELLTAENVADVVAKAVAKAVAPVRKAAGLPTNLIDDGDPEDPVEKSEPHYLAGIL